MLLALAETVSAQPIPRTFGARRFLLDDGTNAATGLIYMTDNGGSLGIDLNGNVNGTFPSTCALLDLSSTTKGFLTPRMTTLQELAICGGTPPEGLIVYNTTTHTLDIYASGSWGAISGWTLNGNSIGAGGTGIGQNYIGTNNAQDFVMATSGAERARINAGGQMGVGTAPNALWALTVGVVGTNSTLNTGNEKVNGTFTSAGNSTVGTTAGTVNSFGNGGTATNTIGTNATSNSFGVGSALNNFGTGATANNMGTAGTSTNTILGTTNINASGNSATAIGSTGNTSGVSIASNNAAAVTLDVAAITNNLVLNNINSDALPTQWLTLNGSNQVRVTPLASIAEQGVSYVNEGGNLRFRLGSLTNAGVPFLANRFVNLNASNLSFTSNGGALTPFLITGGAAPTITTVGTAFINNSGNAATSIGSVANTSPVSIASNNANAITLDVANAATNNLVLNNIRNGALATDINFLVQTAPTSGNVRWRTLSSFITGSQGVEVTYVGGIADAHFAPNNNTVLFTSERYINTDGFTLHVTSGTPGANELITAGGTLVTINNNVAGITNIGNVAGSVNHVGDGASQNTFGAGATLSNVFGNGAPNNNIGVNATSNFIGAVAVSTNDIEGLNNTMNASGTNTITGATNINIANGLTTQIGTTTAATTNIGVLNGTNRIAGTTTINNNVNNNTSISTGTSTGTTTIGNTGAGGAVSINSSVSTTTNAPVNTINASGAAGNNLNANAGQNTLIGQTGNTVTATTGNNTIGAAAQNLITGGTGNTITATANNNTLNAAAQNALTGGTGNTVTATTGNNLIQTNGAGQNNLNSNGAGGQNNLNAVGAGGSNNVLGTTNINVTGGATTNIATTATATTNIGVLNGTNNIAGTTNINTGTTNTTSIGNNAASSNTVISVGNVAGNNLTLNNIVAGANTDAAFLDMTTVPNGNVRTRTIQSMITGSNGVSVEYPNNSLADAHFADANNKSIFTTGRFINEGTQLLSFTGGGLNTTFITFDGNTNNVNINDATVGNNNIGNGGGATNNIIGGAANTNNIGNNAGSNGIGNSAGTNTIGLNAGTNGIGGRAIAGNTINNYGATNIAGGVINNNIGTNTGTVTNTVLGTTNINVTGAATTQIATTTAATTAIGTTGGTNTIAGNTTINNNVNNTTGINTGTSTGNVTIGNNTGGSGTTTIVSNKGGNGNSIVLDVSVAASNNLQFKNIASDALPTQWLSLTNPGEQVRVTNIAGTALEGIVFATSGGNAAYRLGSGAGDPANAFLQNRAVSLNGNTLTFLAGNGVGNAFVTFNSAAGNTIGLNNTAIGTNNFGFLGGTNTVIGITNINAGLNQTNLTTIGNSNAATSAQRLVVNGKVDAVGTEAIGSPVWDLAVTGDVGASGMIKSGASLLVDGVSGTRRLISDASMTISTDLSGALNSSLTVQTTTAGSALTVQTTGNGDIGFLATGGGNLKVANSGGGTVLVNSSTAAGLTVSNTGGGPVSVTTGNGQLSVQSTTGPVNLGATGSGNVTLSSGGGVFQIKNTGADVQILTATSGNVTVNAAGNTQIQGGTPGQTLTVGAIATPNTTIDIRGSVSMPIRISAGNGNNPNPVSATDYMIAFTDNVGAGNTVLALPAGTQGRIVVIKNLSNAGGKTLQVTPPAGVQIDNLGAGVAQAILPGGNTAMTFVYDVATAMWYRSN